MMAITYVKVPNGLVDSQYIVSVLVTQQGTLSIQTIDHKEYKITELKDISAFLNQDALLFLPQEYVDYLKQMIRTNSVGMYHVDITDTVTGEVVSAIPIGQ